jgi:hypothetical protein
MVFRARHPNTLTKIMHKAVTSASSAMMSMSASIIV